MQTKVFLLFFCCFLISMLVVGQQTASIRCTQADLTINRPDGVYIDEKYPPSFFSGETLALSTKAGQQAVMVILFLSKNKRESKLAPGHYHTLQELELVLPLTKVKAGKTISFTLNWGETFTQDHALAKYRYFKMDNGAEAFYTTLWSNWAGHVKGASEGEITFTRITESTICGQFKVRLFEDTAEFGIDALETGENAMTIASQSFSAQKVSLQEATDRIAAYKSKP